MPVYELILSSDTINEGRIKINNAFSATTGLWSGSTGLQSLIHNNDTGNIADGNYSVVVGYNNQISGNTSFSFGENNSSLGNNSFIGGSGNNNLVYADNCIIISTGSTIIGASDFNSTVTANHSVIIGGYDNLISGVTVSSGIYNSLYSSITGSTFGSGLSTIIGSYNSRLFGLYSSILGGINNEISDGASCLILGGDNCTISGQGQVADSIIVGGLYNHISTAQRSTILNGVGNFIDNAHNDSLIAGGGAQSKSAFTMTFGGTQTVTPSIANNTIIFEFQDGSAYWDGNNNLGPADYAEYFEWKDGNLLNEDRVGYFVSIINDKIILGNTNIIGIVSANPAIIGDSAHLKWKDTFIKDEWGRYLKESYSVYEIEKENNNFNKKEKIEIFIDKNNNIYLEPPSPGNIIGIFYHENISEKKYIRTDKLKILNPNYNPNVEYISREDRPEWSPIGLLGKLYVRTSESITNSKVSVDSNGMAINGTDYHVLETIKEFDGNYGIVKILFK